jgi:DNA-binding NtrC family response regulator
MARILVIDDEEVIRMLVCEILETAGHTVVSASDAESAIELFESGRFDAVVSDVIMPSLSGFELLARLRARASAPPVLLITGAGTTENVDEAHRLGAAAVITKPFAHADLTTAVANALTAQSDHLEALR